MPLITGGGGVSSNRPAGVPRLVTGPLTNGVPYFEDFHAFSLGTSGHPSWLNTAIAGSGTVGASSSGTSAGQLQIITGATSGDGHIVTAAGRTTTAGASLSVTATTQPWVAQFRFSGGPVITNVNWGVALIGANIDATTDWITDPDASLSGVTTTTNSIAITRHAASYSGDTAGNLIARFYETTAVDDATLDLGTVAVSTPIKVEIHWDLTSLRFYRDGALVGSIAAPSVTTWSLKPSIAQRVTGAAARTFSVDSYYQEVSLTSAR